ncbi:trimethylguanosine synthase [Phytophthora infestans T30-4]|uniref:Trimethylguanosine synthase n=1 Tax=Phytophthora infestans (strain T30-4) TaxID=403677 RepID=D0N6V7_PHYIT|nr:trimethylguanosine synthase [Phytophthora infestans T30-4]EEY53306.1 trimethylguanosine synthase [Phytophthora infestans T30-4]|eukprot:XP_002904924.1 trimethylguanosine synthase [Phytophthora infestans T30-4]
MALVTEVRLRSRQSHGPGKGKKSKKNKRRRLEKGDASEDGNGEDVCADMYRAAQAQLEQEMKAAGMEGGLPMSFGGRSRSFASKKRKRSLEEETTIVEKVRVVYDSDGQVAERVVEKVEVDVVKFYLQRQTLFEKFEDGIQLDHESWYSVTPQVIAEHIAKRLACDVVVDPFSGCGGNVIQLAMTCKQVIAIDIDPEKIRMAKHNAAIYGVADKIEFVVGNSIDILPNLKADAVFLSPPWGGVKYSRKRFSLDEMLVKGVSGMDLFARARQVSKNIAYYLPRGTPTKDLEALTPDEPVECEKIFLNKQLKVVTAYYGDLVKQVADPASLNGQKQEA